MVCGFLARVIAEAVQNRFVRRSDQFQLLAVGSTSQFVARKQQLDAGLLHGRLIEQ
jgi:tetrahydromethanopterin S-methyltransferase subunit F